MTRQIKIEHIVALALVALGLASIFNIARKSFANPAPDTPSFSSHLDFESATPPKATLAKQHLEPTSQGQNRQLRETHSETWESVESTTLATNNPTNPDSIELNQTKKIDNSIVWDSEPTAPQTIQWNSGIPVKQVDSAVAELSEEDLPAVSQAALQRKNLQPYRQKPIEPEDPFTLDSQLDASVQLDLNAPNQAGVKSLIPGLPTLDSNDELNVKQEVPTTSAPFQIQIEELPKPEMAELPQSEVVDDNSFYAGFQNSRSSGKVPSRLASTKKKVATPPEPKVEPKTPPKKEPPAGGKTPRALVGTDSFVLADQPKQGDHWKDDRPITDQRAYQIATIKDDFSPDPSGDTISYDAHEQMDIYEGKTLNSNQRPILELGRPWYQLGQLSPGSSVFGKHNQVTPQFLLYGDWRTAVASNTQNGDNVSQVAFEVNLDFDLKITSTERFHMFMSPVDDGNNTRYLLDDDEFVDEFDADIDFGYFEGDMGAIVGGFTNQTLPFDMPFAVGVMPLLLQNGVWMEDAFLGIATTIPARNSPRLGISNMDFTFFAGYDKINSDAFAGDDSAARMYGMASFIEAMNGYFEIDYAYFDDRTAEDRSYHNIGFGFTRRFGRLLSNSTRVIVNTGQQSAVNSADGVLLLSENSLITRSPSTLVPYMNFFAGFDRPQSAARAAAAGGVLRNTGLLFESDGMTGYPTLDPTANDTFGGAFGLNLIADDFSQQLVVEMAALGVMNEDANRNAPGAQYGVAFRYQLPISNAVIIRMDGMYGFLENSEDVRGLRLELRHKY